MDMPAVQSDEISLKELILKIKEWISYFKSKWLIIFFSCIVCGAIGLTNALLKKPQFTALLTFVLEEEKSGGGLSSALGLANSLGIDFGGGGAGGAFSGSNLLELMKSRMIVEKTLLSPVQINDKQMSLATFYIEIFGMKKEWKEQPELNKVRFDPTPDRNKFTVLQDSLLGVIYQQIVYERGLLNVSQKDKKVSILTIEMKSENELFSKIFTETLAKVVSEYYVDVKSKKAKLNYDILQKQTDSVRNELNAAIGGVAIANDNTYNLNPAYNAQRVPSARRQIDVQANMAILTQLVTNLEMSKVSLRRETPLIQIIDSPTLPLKKEKVSKFKMMLMGGFLGALFALIWLGLRRAWQKLMSSEY